MLTDGQEFEFLSCLFGSEEGSGVGDKEGDFLSCLFGSEAVKILQMGYVEFLSCLFGSEECQPVFNWRF